ncbi:MAG: hypothetical protein K1X57_11470 [Gemmataceae bacterium]|nr:hypothetical protein [Gemmataceae bacterium]
MRHRRVVPVLRRFEDRLTPATIAWTGSVSNLWSVAGNWSGGVVPGAGDVAQFNSGKPAVTVDTPQTVSAVEFNAGWAGPVTLTASLTTTGAGSKWDAGSVVGPGTWNAGGTVTLNGGTVVLNGAGLNITGTLNHITSSNINAFSMAAITIGASGTYDFQSDGDVAQGGGGASTTNVLGVIKKSGGIGTSTFSGVINNQGGTWNAISGKLNLASAGGTHTGGVFLASAGAEIDLTGGLTATWKGSYSGSGAGLVSINSGTATLDPLGTTFNFPASLFEWNGGTLSGGMLINTAALQFNSGTLTLSNATLINQGTIIHKTTGNLNTVSSQVQNTATGVYDFQSDGDIVFAGGTQPVVTNGGLIRKSVGVGESSVTGAVSLPGGVWEAQTGTLRLAAAAGQTHTGGQFKASAGAVLNLTGAVASTWKGTFVGSGAGAIEANGTMTADAAGATWDFPAATPLHWVGGTMTGGQWTNAGFLSIDGGTVIVSSTTLINVGTITHSASGNLQMVSGQLQNTIDGLYDFQSDADIQNSGGTPPIVANSGLIRKSAGIGESSVTGAVSLPGSVWEAQSGTLRLAAATGQTHTGGLFKASAGATLNLTGAVASTWKGTFISSGAGAIEANGSMTADAAGATWNFQASTPLNWVGGTMTGGPWTNSGFLRISSGTVAVSSTTLINSGTITHTASTNLQMTSGSLQIDPTGLYDFQSDADIQNSGGTTPIITNKGLIRKSAGVGTTLVPNSGTYVSDGGLLDVRSGTIQLPAAYAPNRGGLLGKGTLNNPVNNIDGFVRPGPISGTLVVNGNYAQGASGLFIPEMKGTTVSDFTTMQVNGTVTLGGVLQPQVAYAGNVGDSFTVISNDGVDPVVGTFANAPEGGSVTSAGTTFSVTYKGGTGNDVVLTITNVNPGPTTPPKVVFVAPNGGGVQRSRVTSLLVQFDQPIVQAGSTAAAFQLVRQSDSAGVTLGGFDPGYFNGVFSKFGIAPVLLDFATLTFISGPVDFGSLADGRYTLTIQANQVTSAFGQLDGNGDGTGGDSYTLAGTPANGLFRLFGDVDGSGQVTSSDFLAFRLAFLSASAVFDFDNSGSVDSGDFLAFRLRFLQSV